MMNPRCALGMYRETTVVSFPPCGPAVEVKAPSRFSVQFTLKPQTTQAVYECFQLRRRIAKTRRGAEYDSIGPLSVGRGWSSVLGEHPFAAVLPAGNFGHHSRRNDIRHAAKPDFGSRLTGSFTDGFRKRFYRAVTGVKHNENVCFWLRHHL